MIVIVNFPPTSSLDRRMVVPTSPFSRFTARYLITNLPLTSRLRIAHDAEPVECEYVRWYEEALGARFKVDMEPGKTLALKIQNLQPLEFRGYLIGETGGKAVDPDDAPMVLPHENHVLV